MEQLKKYRPSNGPEGMWFIEEYCSHCIHENFINTAKDDDKKCQILSDTMIYRINDPEYPKEWIYDKNGEPICTEYKHWDWGNDGDPNDPQNPKVPVPDDPNQLLLFTFDEQIDELLKQKEFISEYQNNT